MTALEQYERLESIGLWKESADAQRREVIVSFGNATLVLSDKNENPLTHWSLAAVRRVQKDGSAVTYAPDGETEEALEIDDDLMVKAIETIQSRLRRGLPKPGRVRWVIGGGITAVVLALALFWFPDAIARYAASIVPDAKAEQIGQQVLRQVTEFSGEACSSPQGNNALRLLEDRLIGTRSNRILVLELGARNSSHLPGGLILVNRRLLENYDDPEVAAGFIVMERAIEDETPPLLALFSTMGTASVVSFLASGEISESALKRYAESRVTGQSQPPAEASLLTLFELARLGTKPFATLLAKTGVDTSGLAAGAIPPVDQRPLMRDGAWVALQSICDGD